MLAIFDFRRIGFLPLYLQHLFIKIEKETFLGSKVPEHENTKQVVQFLLLDFNQQNFAWNAAFIQFTVSFLC